MMPRTANKWLLTVLLLTLALTLAGSWRNTALAAAAEAERGSIDLSGRQASGANTPALNGEWEFYWNRLLTPEDFAASGPAEPPDFIRVPAFWHKEEAAGSGSGHATYRLRVRLGEDAAGKPYALYMPYGIESAYRLWINGEEAAAGGRTGTSRSAMAGKYEPRVVPFTARADNEILLQVSNYVQRTGGVWDPIRIGEADAVNVFWNKRSTSELFTAGAIVMMGLYHLGLFSLRRQDRAPLYFGGFCLLFGLRSLFMGEVYVNQLFPGLGFEGYKKLEYLGQYLSPALFILYVQSLFPKDIHKTMVRILVGFDLLLGVLVLVLPAWLFTYTLPVSHVSLAVYAPYVIYVFIAAARRGREGALLCCILFGVMALTIVNDLLYYNSWIASLDMTKFGLFVFIFAQAFLLSIKFSKAFRSVEQLSAKQRMWSQELEATVGERTRELTTTLDDLKNAQKQLVESEKMAALGALVAGIAHEINTPVGISVTASSHLGEKTREMEERFRENRLKKSDLDAYLQLVDESARIVSANLARTAELVKGFKQVAVDQSTELQRSFDVNAYLRDVLVSLGPQLRKCGIEAVLSGPEGLAYRGDPGAFSQILTNLVMNSITHAYDPGQPGTIRIETGEENGGLYLRYADDGKGMTPEVKERIYDPFFTTNRAGGGTGLGMHIIYNLVSQSLGGTIECDSEPGKGTIFTIHIPVGETA